MEKITVFIADWQVLFREGIHFTLSGEEDIEVIGEASDNEEALSFIEKNQPRLAILNADHSKLSGMEVTRRLKQSFPSVSVVLILDTDNDELLLAAIKSGANACLTKEADPGELVNTIRQVAQGARPVNEALLRPAIAARILEEFDDFAVISEEVNNLLARLSPEETKTLRCLAERNPLPQAAQILGISEPAIRHQLELVLTKLVANDHNREVIEAVQSNLPTIVAKIAKARRAGRPLADFITKDEFSTFKETLRERLKSFLGELG